MWRKGPGSWGSGRQLTPHAPSLPARREFMVPSDAEFVTLVAIDRVSAEVPSPTPQTLPEPGRCGT